MTLSDLRSYVVTFLCMGALSGLLCGLTYLSDVGRIQPLKDAQFIQSGVMCNSPDCVAARPVALPLFTSPDLQHLNARAHLRFVVTAPPGAEGVQALYFPKLADNLDIRLNGQTLRVAYPQERLWNMPVIVAVPPALWRPGANRLDVVLTGAAPEGLELWPFHFGPETALTKHHAMRMFFGADLAMFALALMAVIGLAFVGIWAARRTERSYLWLGLSCLTACIFLVHFALGRGFPNYAIWTTIWVMSVAVYVFFILLFLISFLKLRYTRLTAVYCAMLVIGLAAGFLVPAPLAFHTVFAFTFGTAFFATLVLVLIWRHRDKLSRSDFGVFFSCMLISHSLGLYAMVLHLSPAPGRSMHLFHVMPLFMSMTCLWLILAQLVRSLRAQELLAARQSVIIDEKTQELQSSFQKLAQAETRQAISLERERIMSDLHDGIGGQLVSALNYVRGQGLGVGTLDRALEDIIRELGLLVDAVGNDQSLVTLLGMQRTRLEDLLERNGLRFDWQVEDEPDVSHLRGAANLEIARIVQEAITNAIKHANARVIGVQVDANSVSVRDDGHGFDVSVPRKTGFGLRSMQQRAGRIGAEVLVSSSGDGTTVRIAL